MTVVVNMPDAAEILRRRGLEPGGRIQQLFTLECAKQMDPYVPMDQGILKNTKIIETDRIIYNTPYARSMYYGVVMVDPVTGAAGFLTKDGWKSRKGVQKVKSNREYKYHGAPMRGKLWDVRMWADKKHIIVKNIAAAAGGKPG